MAKSNQKKRGIELEPDAWQRFERAVDVVAKSPPQPKKKNQRENPYGGANLLCAREEAK
jgi:hypothetical protein